MADALTAKLYPEDERRFLSLKAINDRRRNVTVARRLIARLASHRQRLSCELSPGHPTESLLRAAQAGDQSELAHHGIDVGYAQLNEVLAPLVSGAPFVEIETVGPYAAHHVDHQGRLDVSFDNMPSDERSGILLASVLRDAFSECRNVRIVALLDDLHEAVDGHSLTSDERDRYVVQMSRIFYEKGVLRYDDIPGSDYRLLRESAHLKQVDELIEQLRVRSRVLIQHTDDGDVLFRPTDEWIGQLGLNSAGRVREFRRHGILLKKAGRPTCQALDAAGFLNPTNRQIVHLVMLDKAFRTQQDKTYTLLRALGIARGDSYHNVFFDSARLSPEVTVLVMCEILIRELRLLYLS